MKIEKGIPIPTSYGDKTGLTATLRQMEIGDSVYMEKGSRQNTYHTAKELGIKVKIRTEGKGFRFWRSA